MKDYKEYKKKVTVMAKLFEEGDEDGVNCLRDRDFCYYLENQEKYKKCDKCTAPVKIKPYISTLENQMHFGFWEDNYICIGPKNERWLVRKDIFEETYEEIPKVIIDKEPTQRVDVLELMKACGDVTKEEIEELKQLKMDKFYSNM